MNSVNPAAVRTGFLQSYGLASDQAEKLYDEMANRYPVGRVGEVEDTTAAIAFLIDDEKASFLTGLTMGIDGGSLISTFK